MQFFSKITNYPLLLLPVLLSCVLSVCQAQDFDELLAEVSVSEQRVADLDVLATAFFRENSLDTSEYRASKAVLASFSEKHPDCPLGVRQEPVGRETINRNASRIARELTATEFPPLNEEKLLAEAAEQYPIHQVGDIVDVWHSTNPKRNDLAHGVFRGKNRRAIQIDGMIVLFEDILKLKGGDKVVLSFDARASEKLREEYVEQKKKAYEEEKGRYHDKVLAAARRAEEKRITKLNEDAGYVFYDGEWKPLRKLVPVFVENARRSALRKIEQAKQMRIQEKRDRIAEKIPAQVQLTNKTAEILLVDIKAERQAMEERLKQEKAEMELAAKRKAEAEEEARRKAAELLAAKNAEKKKPKPEPKPVETPTVETTATIPLWAYIAAAVIAAVGFAAYFFFIKPRNSGQKSLEKFFQGKGKAQRTFWQMADEDPEHFKFVAYRYATAESARQVLLQLSYVQAKVGGELFCSHDIHLGYGPHQDRFVSFVGGVNLNYALWREASAIFPEFPGAEYFRVSTAPEVNLEIPDLESLLSDGNLRIEHVANREGEGTDYSQYYIYRAMEKADALEFLKHANVQETAVHVVVLTPDGVFGKDENGIYEDDQEKWQNDLDAMEFDF